MNRYFVHLSYKGSSYHGWQRQPDVISIQEVLESVFSKILKERIVFHGCGRTDKGVHASQYIAHIESINYENNFDLVKRANRILPDDIKLISITAVESYQNAQRHARARTYHYYFHGDTNPFINNISTYRQDLAEFNISKMRAACSVLVGSCDFRSFCKQPDQNKDTICHVTSCYIWRHRSSNRYCLTITANRFLKSMIRVLMFQLWKIGKGTWSKAELMHHLETQELLKFINSAPPQGLFLAKVEYDFLSIDNQLDPLSIDPDRWTLY